MTPAADAETLVDASLAAWPGPLRHVLLLQEYARIMSVATAGAALDFAFSTPAPETVELVCDDPAAVWPAIWFTAQYARRKAEWTRRDVRILLRSGKPASPAQARFLAGHEVEERRVIDVSGAPAALPKGASALALVRGAKNPEGWVDRLVRAGMRSVLFYPALLSEAGVSFFLGFYAAARNALAGAGVADEWEANFLRARPWALPGYDVLECLAYDSAGKVWTSEEGKKAGGALFLLGELGRLRFEEMAQLPSVPAAAAASLAENRPLCFQCAYKPYCAPAPSVNMRLQGTIWGQTPSSALCRLHMGVLDVIFARASASPRRS